MQTGINIISFRYYTSSRNMVLEPNFSRERDTRTSSDRGNRSPWSGTYEIQPNPTLRHAFPLENTVWRIPVATRGDATLPLIYPGNSAPPRSPALQLVKEGYTAAAAGKRPISLPRQDFLHVHGKTFSRYGT